MNKILILLAVTAAICFSIVCACNVVPETTVITPEPAQPARVEPATQEPKVLQQATLAYLNARTYTVKRTFSIVNGDAGVTVIRVWLPSITDWDSQKVVPPIVANFAPASSQGDSLTATRLTGNETSPCRMARIYYEYVNNYMDYRPIDGVGGALFALKNGYGECGDYAALFVALCRASGIPARPVVGRWALPEDGDNHVWAEFYLQDVGWVPVDPSFGPKNNADTFGNLDNKLIIFNKAYNISLLPNPQWISPSAELLQSYFWEFWCGSGDSKSVKEELLYDSYGAQ
jgi:transglutaminase-like putative cysteine protease